LRRTRALENGIIVDAVGVRIRAFHVRLSRQQENLDGFGRIGFGRSGGKDPFVTGHEGQRDEQPEASPEKARHEFSVDGVTPKATGFAKASPQPSPANA
jgi:hypothetical protein